MLDVVGQMLSFVIILPAIYTTIYQILGYIFAEFRLRNPAAFIGENLVIIIGHRVLWEYNANAIKEEEEDKV